MKRSEVLTRLVAEYRTMVTVTRTMKVEMPCDICGDLSKGVRCERCWSIVADALEVARVTAVATEANPATT